MQIKITLPILTIFVFIQITFGHQMPAHADESTFQPAIAWGGTKVIKKGSWGDLVSQGISKFEAKTNVSVHQVFAEEMDDYVAQIEKLAEEGYSPIIMTTSAPKSKKKLEQIIDRYPDRRFILTNGAYSIPNGFFIIFAYQETSFLAGYSAARKSKTGKVGFIGGVDIPVIRDYLCGYIKGVHYANPDIDVLFDFVGDGFKGWNDKPRAAELANLQIDNGADIIYTAAGASGPGALEAAHKRGKLGIGVDKNQNDLFPGSVLTSTVVHVDNTIYRALLASYHNVWGEQLKLFGLQEGAIELAFDEHNAPLISPELKLEIALVQEDIILKKISLPRYTEPESCLLGGNILF
ncbi:BMP family ABC transporter substrate-binding protein [Neptunomonas sp.]|uniref:BMP family ABC transporter substrate-binding protein n=1 Tax=Neptunomonas sp. TaxID=1971898 RepID=UPI00356ACF33